MSKTNTIIKPYLKRFILQTHPDFFQYDLTKKQINANSIQKLYNVFQLNKTDPTTTKLDFYLKGQVKQNKPITCTFNGHDSEWSKAQSFFQLCQKSNIPVLQSDLDIVQSMLDKQDQKERKPHKSLTKEFAEKLYQEHTATSKGSSASITVQDVLNHTLIMFDPNVENKKQVASNLCRWLPQLHPQLWWNKVPMLIISPNSELPPEELTPDIIIMKSNLTLEGKFSTNVSYQKQ
jgi:HSP90 family molecular chaperone